MKSKDQQLLEEAYKDVTSANAPKTKITKLDDVMSKVEYQPKPGPQWLPKDKAQALRNHRTRLDQNLDGYVKDYMINMVLPSDITVYCRTNTLDRVVQIINMVSEPQ
jgi:hypothetical protein